MALRPSDDRCGRPTAAGTPCRFRVAVPGAPCHQHDPDEPHTGGRPRIEFSADQVEQIEKLAAVLSQEQVCDFFGITEKTLRARMYDDPAVGSAWARGRAKAVAKVGSGVLQRAIAGDPQAAQLFLTRIGGWSEATRHEVSGPGGGVIPTELTVRLVRPDDDDYHDYDDHHEIAQPKRLEPPAE